jgi:phosphoribosylamine-glycine ligase
LNILNCLLYNSINKYILYHNNNITGGIIIMKRQERKNMIEFISKMKDIETETLMYMTDEDIEHIYSSAYHSYIQLAE